MKRREFPKRIKAQIVHRAMTPNGNVKCEGCGAILGMKRYEIDHTIAEGLVIDKTKPLTKEDGRLLGLECCHKPKTVKDKGDIARAVRRSAKHAGIKSKRPAFQKPPGVRWDWKRGRFTKEAR